MIKEIDTDAILAPISADNPAGEDLRYTQVYEDIKEARRSEDALAMGDWQREVKTADWEQVRSLSTDALAGRTKDFQIAAWLTEALVMSDGFSGLETGLRIMTGILEGFWDTAYPQAEGGDIEYRLAPFEFLNDRISSAVQQVPLSAAGHSWLTWQESRDVGYEVDTRNKYGDVDEKKKQRRDELMAEGKISAEVFDAAVVQTPATFSAVLADDVLRCQEAFKALDRMVDEKFGRDAPRISDLGHAIEECSRVVKKIYGERKASRSEQAPTAEVSAAPVAEGETGTSTGVARVEQPLISEASLRSTIPSAIPETPPSEELLWSDAIRTLETGGIKAALDKLQSASFTASSERERYRYRLLVAKLCLRAGRPDLARPLVEELHALIEELHLQRWESPLWIAEVLEALYQCLTGGEPSDEDMGKANELFKRICAMDVTKAILYKR